MEQQVEKPRKRKERKKRNKENKTAEDDPNAGASVASLALSNSIDSDAINAFQNKAYENDKIVQEQPNASLDTTIDIDDDAERPSLVKRSSSLEEVVVHSAQSKENVRAQSPQVAIEIPDSPRNENIEKSEYPQGEQIPVESKAEQLEDMENGILDNHSVSMQESNVVERPASSQKNSRPNTAERISSVERQGSPQINNEGRPNSAQIDSPIGRPSAPSPLEADAVSGSSTGQLDSDIDRPASAQRKSSPLERPDSSQRRIAIERPSSSQTSNIIRNSISEDRKSFQGKEEEAERQRPGSATSTAPDRSGRSEKPSGTERPGSSEKYSSSERPGSSERPVSSKKPSSSERPGSSERQRSFERPGSSERPRSSDRPRSAARTSKTKRLSASQLIAEDGLLDEDAIIERPSSNARERRRLANRKQETVEVEDGTGVGTDEKEHSLVLQGDEDAKEIEEEPIASSSPVPALLGEDDELPWAMYNKMKTREEEQASNEEENKEESGDEVDSDDESVDEEYEPQTNETLPDLYEVMGSLDHDKIELNQKTKPPSILNSEQQRVYERKVEELKQGIAEDEIKIYLDEFEKQVEQEILMIGNISLDDVQDEEKRLREEHISFQQEQAKVQRKRQEEIMQAMERAKKYVMNKYKEKFREIRMREEHLMQKDRTYKDEIHRAFRRSESQLRKALKRRKAEVQTMYGDLMFADGQYGGSKGRRWKIDWNRAPQPIQIRLKCLRGVKDKLPSSRYVLMVSLYDRIGGHVMKWSNLKGQQWGGATLPIDHDGEFFNIEMKIDQSVFTVCPSRPDMRPGMILVFELFILRGPVTPTDKVVGWGCFPICDAEFNVIDGKYKAPILRGEMDSSIDRFEIIEKLMAIDLENWLCNFYFDIIKLPRYMGGQKEYEVELQFTSGLLSAPDRTKAIEENVDGEKAIFGSRSDVNSPDLMSRSSLHSPSISSHLIDENSNISSIEKPPFVAVDDTEAGRSSASTSERKPSADSKLPMYRADHLSTELRKRKRSSKTHGEIHHDDGGMTRPMTSVETSRKLVEEKGLQLSDDDGDSSGTDYEEKDVLAVKKESGFRPVKGQPGMFYKVHYNTPSDVYAKKIYTMMPKTPLLSKKKGKRKLTHLEELDTHSFHVKSTWSNKGHIEHKGRKKMQYMGRMMLAELGISQVKSREFWAMILMILITYWMRMYLHYIGQWVALLSFLIPINKFEFQPHTVNLNYQNTLLRTREEIALIMIGPFTNILVFVMMVLISVFVQLLFERFPNIFSRLIMAFGIHCVLDPVWILLTDSAILRFENRGGDFPIGDAFKLYWHFDRYYNNDNVTLFVSIALTLFLYFVTMFSACAILYMYFLRVHNNGRLMDVYWRLHGKEGDFFLPYDLEMSNEELSYVCRKAEQWRGEEGERRKTAVYDYIWEEEEMAHEDWDNPGASTGRKTGAKEVTTHVSLHTLHLDGLRELYRHFLKLPDGAIVEVFGEMNVPGIDEGVKQALMKRTAYQSLNNGPTGNRRPSRVSSFSNFMTGDGSNGKTERRTSGFLEVPTSSSAV